MEPPARIVTGQGSNHSSTLQGASLNPKTTMTFDEAEAMYEERIGYQSGKYEGVRLENNTRLVKRGESYGVKLHNTVVVTLHPNGSSEIKTGGWHTLTTRRRINKYSPHAHIVQRDYDWFINPGPGHQGVLYQEGETWTPGYGKVRFRPNGKIDTDKNLQLA